MCKATWIIGQRVYIASLESGIMKHSARVSHDWSVPLSLGWQGHPPVVMVAMPFWPCRNAGSRRVTFLVNIWLNYTPVGLQVLPEANIGDMSRLQSVKNILRFPV